MTPARHKLLTDAVDLIRAASNAESFDADATRDALIRKGAVFVDGNTNTLRLGGIAASLTWDKGEQLILRWAANARKALAEADPAAPATEEEE